ncbi:MAG: T9SS type A sorting domain-containing protein [bacterium]|nr:T9SS type A sorting domain-containing protein [bacterium]
MRNFYLILLTTLAFNVNAQWKESTYPFDFYGFNLISYYNKDTIFGQDGATGTYFTGNGGLNFTKKSNDDFSRYRLYWNREKLVRVGGGLFHSTDFGETWEIQVLKDKNNDTLKIKGSFVQQNISKNGQGFTLVARNNLNCLVYHTQDFGDSWLLVDSNNVNISKVNSISGGSIVPKKLFDFDSISIVQRHITGNLMWIFENYGKKSYEIDLTTQIKTGGTVVSYAFENENKGIIVVLKGQESTIYKTEDRLKTIIEVANFPFNSIARVADYAKTDGPKKGFYIVGTSNNGSFYSIDFGQNWKNLEIDYNHNLINFFNASIGISSSNSGTNKIRYFDGSILNSITNINPLNEQLKIFPNPGNNFVTIHATTEIVNLKLFDYSGKQLAESQQNSIETENLISGIYLIEITSINGHKQWSKWVKQ